MVVILEPEPGRPGLALDWYRDADCDQLRAIAELIVNRLPLRGA